MKINKGILCQGVCLWIGVFISLVNGVPLFGPDLDAYQSISPFTDWHEPTIQVVSIPIPGAVATNPQTPGTMGSPQGPGPRTNIITTPCKSGYLPTGGGCRRPFSFRPNGNFRGDTSFYRGRQFTGPRPGPRSGRAGFGVREEPDTPEPEQIRGD